MARRNVLTHTKKINQEVDDGILIKQTDEGTVSVTVKATSCRANDRNELRPRVTNWIGIPIKIPHVNMMMAFVWLRSY